MGGAALTPEMKNLIIKTWTNLKSKKQETTSTQVRKTVGKYIKGKENQYGKLPKLRTFQEIIRNAKKKLINDKTIDEEWTMACLINNDLPAEAIPYVTKVWRYAINTDERFTVIQAKWISRLYRIWDDITDLWYYSSWYADIERTSILSTEDPNTFMPDTTQFLTAWETMTLMFTGHYEGKHISLSGFRPFITKQGEVVEELLHYKNFDFDPYNIYSPDEIEQVPDSPIGLHRLNIKLSTLIRNLPTLSSMGFDYDSKMVYLRFFTYLIKSPKWKDKFPEEAIELINELRQWVLTTYKTIKTTPGEVELYDHSPIPVEILLKVGYEFKESEEV